MNFLEYINFNKKNIFSSLHEMSLFSGGNFIAQLLMMIYTIVIARELGPDQLGIYSGIYAIVGITVIIVSWGLDTWILKVAHQYKSIQRLTGNILSIKIILGLFFGTLLFLLLPIVRKNYFSSILVTVVVLDIFFDVLINTIIASWNIQRKIKLIAIVLISSKFAKLSLLVFLLQIDHFTPLTISLSRLLVSVLVFSLCLLYSKPVLFKNSWRNSLLILKYASEFGISEILAVIYANGDVAILSILSFSTNVGLYSPASGVIHALFVIPNSLYILFLPRFAKKFSNMKGDNVKKEIIKITFLFSFIGLLMYLGVVLFGKIIIIKLLGNSFWETGNLLTILSPILLIKSIEFGFAVVIVTIGLQKKRLIPQFLVAIINIFGNLILIPIGGITAVAWVYVISESILMIGYGLIVLRSMNKITV